MPYYQLLACHLFAFESLNGRHSTTCVCGYYSSLIFTANLQPKALRISQTKLRPEEEIYKFNLQY